MSFWGKIFGTEAALKAGVDAVTSGLDKLVFTDEEKAEMAAKERSEARGMVVAWMEATQGQNLARRVISLAITATWLGFYILAALAHSIGIFIVSVPELKELSGFLFAMANSMDDAVMLILAFYFAAPHMSALVETILKGRTERAAARKG